MPSRQPYRPLWADPPPEPEPRLDVVVHRVVVDADEEPAPEGTRPSRRPLAVVAALLAACVLVIAAREGDAVTVDTLASAWEDVPMRCETLRLDGDDGAVEAFACRASGSRPLPPGLYGTPDARWTSDFTRRDARANVITISPDGELRGWAVYPRER